MCDSKKLVFLYTELADYFYKSILYFLNKHDADVLIVSYKPSKDAPFIFRDFSPRLEMIYKSDLKAVALHERVSRFDPDLIYVSGWKDGIYNDIAKTYTNKIPVVLGLDNIYLSTMKQKFNVLIGKYYLHRIFNHLWVPGQDQYYYARLLGYKKNQITTGLYCADINHFEKSVAFDVSNFEKRILYLGRFVDYKFVVELYQVFNELKSELFNDWKMTFIGNGDLKKYLVPYEFVEVYDFKQPSELLDLIQSTTVFCLPSTNEHWGVVLHEMAAAGKLLIASDSVSAASDFLIDGYNGYIFSSGNIDSLKLTLKLVMGMSEKEVISFGKRSNTISKNLNYDIWSGKLLSILNS